MKSKEIIRRGLAIALATVMILSEGMPAYAADISGGDVLVGDVSGGDISVGEPCGEDISGGDISGGNGSPLEFPGEEEIAEMFPGMAQSYQFDAEEIAGKAEVYEYAGDWQNCANDSYVPNELIFLADSEEEALEYAKAYNATLTEYSYGVAVINLNASDAYAEATVMDAMEAAANPDSNLPAVWPNYYQYLDEEVIEYDSYDTVADSQYVEDYSDPHLNSYSTYYQWFHFAVNAHVARKHGKTGQGIKVAVIDTGIRTSHEDFSGFVTIDIGCGVEDDNNHGSNVCGIIGATANNGKGGCGIAPDCTLMSIRVFQNNSASSANIIKGINAAVANGANIINMSLGGANYSGVYQQAITNAYENGVAVFCSAGNNFAESIHYPGGYEHATSVAALNQNLTRAAFSNYGKTVRYAAPGVKMYAPFAVLFDGTSSSTIYGSMQGTSQASPVIAGCAALLYAYVDGSGSQKVDNLLAALDKSCTSLPGVGVQKGMVNMAKAFELTDDTQAPPKPVFETKPGTYNTKELRVKLTAEPGTMIYYSVDGKPVTYKNGKVSDNAILLYGGDSFLISGKSVVTVNAIAIKTCNWVPSANVSARYTLKPPVESITIVPKNSADTQGYVALGKTLALKANFLPDYAADKKVNWVITNSPDGKVSVNSSGVVKVSADAEPGTYYVRATSASVATAQPGIFRINVVQDDNPITSVTLKNRKVSVLAGKSAAITDIAILHKDKTAGTLNELKWSSSDTTIANVSINAYTNTLTITGKKAGKVKIVGTALDGNGKSLTIEATITEPVYGLKISGSNTVAAGKYITLKTTTDKKPTDGRLDWSVFPAGKGVSVSNGRVTAQTTATLGTYKITAAAKDGSGATATYEVTVVASAATRLSVSTNKVDLPKDRPLDIKVDCDSENWDVTSSNIALLYAFKKTDAEGKKRIALTPTGKGTGKVTVTAFTTDGSNKKAVLTVNITNSISKLMIAPASGHSDYVAQGTRVKMSAWFLTEKGKIDSKQKKLIWSSSDKSIMTVDSNGYVTCKAPSGMVTITAKTTDGFTEATYYLTAVKKITGLAVLYEDENRDGRLRALDKNIYVPTNTTKTYRIYMAEGSSIYAATSQRRFSVKCSNPGVEAGIIQQDGYACLMFQTRKEGTYKVTLGCNDGSTGYRTYTIHVSDDYVK